MIDINAVINDAIAKAVAAQINEIHAQYSTALGMLNKEVVNLKEGMRVLSRVDQEGVARQEHIKAVLHRLSQQVYEANQAIGVYQAGDGPLNDRLIALERAAHDRKGEAGTPPPPSEGFRRAVEAIAERVLKEALNSTRFQGAVQNEVDDYFDSQRGEHRINDAVSERLGEEYVKKCDFSAQLQECLNHAVELKVVVE